MTAPTLPAADLAIDATVAALDAATDREQVRQILTDWRAENWNTWATQEAHARNDDAAAALAAGDLRLLECDASWRVDYFPADIRHAELRALARLPTGDVPAVYTRTRD